MHPKSGSFLLSYLLWRQSGKNTKYDSRQKYKREKQSKDSTGKIFFRRKEFFITKVFPYHTVCFGRLTTLPSFAAGQKVVSQTPRGWRLVKCLRCCCRPSRLLVELAAKYNPPPGLCILNAETHPCCPQKRKKNPPFAFLTRSTIEGGAAM